MLISQVDRSKGGAKKIKNLRRNLKKLQTTDSLEGSTPRPDFFFFFYLNYHWFSILFVYRQGGIILPLPFPPFHTPFYSLIPLSLNRRAHKRLSFCIPVSIQILSRDWTAGNWVYPTSEGSGWTNEFDLESLLCENNSQVVVAEFFEFSNNISLVCFVLGIQIKADMQFGGKTRHTPEFAV